MRLKVVYSIVQPSDNNIGHRNGGGSKTTHIARSTKNDTIRHVDDDESPVTPQCEFASVALKSCMALICYSRPDLVPSQTTDYAVSALDPFESHESAGVNDVFEGLGMMSWLLAENGTGTARTVGKIIEGYTKHAQNKPGPAGRTLEIVLELIPRLPVKREGLFSSLAGISLEVQPPQSLHTPALQLHAPVQPAPAAFHKHPIVNPPLAIFETATAFQPLPEVDVSNPVPAEVSCAKKPESRQVPTAHLNLFIPKHSNTTAAPLSGPIAGPSTQPSPAEISPRMKSWPAGCCGCGKTESLSWRTRKRRLRPLHSPADAQDAKNVEAQWKAHSEDVAKLCQECASLLPRRGQILTQPTKKQANLSRALMAQTSPAQASHRANKATVGVNLFTSYQKPVAASSPTQPSKSLAMERDRRKIIDLVDHLAEDGEFEARQEGKKAKRAKFVRSTALSQAVLKMNERATPIDPHYVSVPAWLKPSAITSDKSVSTGTPADFDNDIDITQIDPSLLEESGVMKLSAELNDFLLRSSPGTAMRAALGDSFVGPHNKSQESPSKLLSWYLNDFDTLDKTASPISASGSQNRAARPINRVLNPSTIFSPGFSATLSTPLRHALQNIASPSRDINRARSEEPTDTNARMQRGLQEPALRPCGSDDNLLGSTSLLINLMPPTADRQQRPAATDIANEEEDFAAFLRKASSSLFSSSPPRKTAAKPTGILCSPLKHRTRGMTNGMPLPLGSGVPASLSDWSIARRLDLANLPPSSPPPLPDDSVPVLMRPVLHHAHSSFDMSHTQSPISVATSVTPAEDIHFNQPLSAVSEPVQNDNNFQLVTSAPAAATQSHFSMTTETPLPLSNDFDDQDALLDYLTRSDRPIVNKHLIRICAADMGISSPLSYSWSESSIQDSNTSMSLGFDTDMTSDHMLEDNTISNESSRANQRVCQKSTSGPFEAQSTEEWM